MFRAGVQAWHQALQNAQRSGVASEAAQQATQTISKAGQMTVQEAQMILAIDANASWKDVIKGEKSVSSDHLLCSTQRTPLSCRIVQEFGHGKVLHIASLRLCTNMPKLGMDSACLFKWMSTLSSRRSTSLQSTGRWSQQWCQWQATAGLRALSTAAEGSSNSSRSRNSSGYWQGERGSVQQQRSNDDRGAGSKPWRNWHKGGARYVNKANGGNNRHLQQHSPGGSAGDKASVSSGIRDAGHSNSKSNGLNQAEHRHGVTGIHAYGKPGDGVADARGASAGMDRTHGTCMSVDGKASVSAGQNDENHAKRKKNKSKGWGGRNLVKDGQGEELSHSAHKPTGGAGDVSTSVHHQDHMRVTTVLRSDASDSASQVKDGRRAAGSHAAGKFAAVHLSNGNVQTASGHRQDPKQISTSSTGGVSQVKDQQGAARSYTAANFSGSAADFKSDTASRHPVQIETDRCGGDVLDSGMDKGKASLAESYASPVLSRSVQSTNRTGGKPIGESSDVGSGTASRGSMQTETEARSSVRRTGMYYTTKSKAKLLEPFRQGATRSHRGSTEQTSGAAGIRRGNAQDVPVKRAGTWRDYRPIATGVDGTLGGSRRSGAGVQAHSQDNKDAQGGKVSVQVASSGTDGSMAKQGPQGSEAAEASILVSGMDAVKKDKASLLETFSSRVKRTPVPSAAGDKIASSGREARWSVKRKEAVLPARQPWMDIRQNRKTTSLSTTGIPAEAQILLKARDYAALPNVRLTAAEVCRVLAQLPTRAAQEASEGGTGEAGKQLPPSVSYSMLELEAMMAQRLHRQRFHVPVADLEAALASLVNTGLGPSSATVASVDAYFSCTFVADRLPAQEPSVLARLLDTLRKAEVRLRLSAKMQPRDETKTSQGDRKKSGQDDGKKSGHAEEGAPALGAADRPGQLSKEVWKDLANVAISKIGGLNASEALAVAVALEYVDQRSKLAGQELRAVMLPALHTFSAGDLGRLLTVLAWDGKDMSTELCAAVEKVLLPQLPACTAQEALTVLRGFNLQRHELSTEVLGGLAGTLLRARPLPLSDLLAVITRLAYQDVSSMREPCPEADELWSYAVSEAARQLRDGTVPPPGELKSLISALYHTGRVARDLVAAISLRATDVVRLWQNAVPLKDQQVGWLHRIATTFHRWEHYDPVFFTALAELALSAPHGLIPHHTRTAVEPPAWLIGATFAVAQSATPNPQLVSRLLTLLANYNNSAALMDARIVRAMGFSGVYNRTVVRIMMDGLAGLREPWVGGSIFAACAQLLRLARVQDAWRAVSEKAGNVVVGHAAQGGSGVSWHRALPRPSLVQPALLLLAVGSAPDALALRNVLADVGPGGMDTEHVAAAAQRMADKWGEAESREVLEAGATAVGVPREVDHLGGCLSVLSPHVQRCISMLSPEDVIKVAYASAMSPVNTLRGEVRAIVYERLTSALRGVDYGRLLPFRCSVELAIACGKLGILPPELSATSPERARGKSELVQSPISPATAAAAKAALAATLKSTTSPTTAAKSTSTSQPFRSPVSETEATDMKSSAFPTTLAETPQLLGSPMIETDTSTLKPAASLERVTTGTGTSTFAAAAVAAEASAAHSSISARHTAEANTEATARAAANTSSSAPAATTATAAAVADTVATPVCVFSPGNPLIVALAEVLCRDIGSLDIAAARLLVSMERALPGSFEALMLAVLNQRNQPPPEDLVLLISDVVRCAARAEAPLVVRVAKLAARLFARLPGSHLVSLASALCHARHLDPPTLDSLVKELSRKMHEVSVTEIQGLQDSLEQCYRDAALARLVGSLVRKTRHTGTMPLLPASSVFPGSFMGGNGLKMESLRMNETLAGSDELLI